MTAVKMPHVIVGRRFAANVKWITLYNDKFCALPEFIITPSLVVKLSTTTANYDGSGVYCCAAALVMIVAWRHLCMSSSELCQTCDADYPMYSVTIQFHKK